MGEENKVTLHGFWWSPYTKRVELALKFKGIPYEYIEEDYVNKSPSLLNYNPVYKKVPVLVHNAKPIPESLIILEYIDETWKTNTPTLLPEDPYKSARVRFWASFIQQQLLDTGLAMVTKTQGEAQDKAINLVFEKLQVLEEGMGEFFPNGTPCIDDKNVGLLEIVIWSLFGPHKAQEEVFGVKFIDPDKFPLISAWVTAIMELPLVKELTLPHEKLVGFLQMARQRTLQSTTT
ncbi:glutathione S-transferase U9-like [Tripterygium wilfordii]|uniref:glutathione S-transferase U9-like n=1 Tax=Tripterygium wilfordii TaxID=458696 RepID=UPI0018F80B27|nr:glutathione S-transferase U9-like [Tripterygium wilfordii]